VSNFSSITFYLPELLLVVTILAAIVFDLIPVLKRFNFVVALAGIVFTGVLLYGDAGVSESLYMGTIAADPFAHFFKWIFLIAAFFTILVSHYTLNLQEADMPEYNSLLLIVLFGLFLMASATNLVTVYLGIETVSLPSYILAGILKNDRKSNEASLKYVIFGAFSSGLMVYGFSWLYGLTGSMSLSGIQQGLAGIDQPLVLYMAILLVLAGFGYKISMVPFHFWTPDVYEGSPTPITGFLSVAPKAAGFAILIRFFYSVFTNGSMAPIAGVDWLTLIAILSAVTMTFGNLIAIQQDNVKRMLAFSSIAHAGYMLMALSILSPDAIKAVMIYLTMYLFMNMGAFFMVIFAENKLDAHTVEDWKGLGRKAPLLAVCMVLFMMSLSGLPPTAGFVGKLYLFAVVIASKKFYWLALIGVINSVISLFYYFRIVKVMWLQDPADPKPVKAHAVISVTLLLFTIPVLLLGIYWTPIINLIDKSIAF